MAEDKETLVYYLGYPGVENTHVTLVKGNHYTSPTKENGEPDIGGAIRVKNIDLQEFLQKNEYQPRGQHKPRNAYTTDPTLAALAKKKGVALEAPAVMTTTDALNMVDDATLESILAARRAGGTPETEAGGRGKSNRKKSEKEADATPTANQTTPEGESKT